MLKLERPIVFFDLETTGLIVDIDRIIEIGLMKIFPDGQTLRLTQRFNPDMRIPVESSAIHGIYNADLADQPRFSEMVKKLHEIFTDCDLGGYAIRRLDIPILTKEFERCGYGFPLEGRRIIDACVIFREKERRDLTAAYKFYCGKELVGAHGAAADNDATYEVFLAQLQKYSDLPRDLDGLHSFCQSLDPCGVDKEGKLVWRDGEAFFAFGRYRHKSLVEVAKIDREYLDWICNKADFPDDFVEICAQAKKGIFPRRNGHNGGNGKPV